MRVGVMIDGPVIPRWVARVLESVDESRFATVAGFVVTAEPPPLVASGPACTAVHVVALGVLAT